jgi:hypothetical protein
VVGGTDLHPRGDEVTDTPKTVVSSQELGVVYWTFATKFTLEFCKKFPYDAGEKDAINARVVEALGLHLWIMLKAVGTTEAEALDEMHRHYLESVKKDLVPEASLPELRTQLLARYRRYYENWKDDAKALQEDFVAAAAAGLFPPGQELSPVAKVHFMSWVLGSMAAALKIRADLVLK